MHVSFFVSAVVVTYMYLQYLCYCHAKGLLSASVSPLTNTLGMCRVKLRVDALVGGDLTLSFFFSLRPLLS